MDGGTSQEERFAYNSLNLFKNMLIDLTENKVQDC